MKIINILIFLFISINLNADIYEGKYKYFKKQTHVFKHKIPVEVSSVNFGYIGSYCDNDYIIRFRKDGGKIRQNLLRKIKRNKEKIEKNKRAIENLKYNEYFTKAEKEIEKKVYIDSNKIWKQQIKDEIGAIKILDSNKLKEGIKYTGYIYDIIPKRGDIVMPGFPIFVTVDDSIARMKLKVSRNDYKYLNNLTIKRNDTIINPKLIKRVKKNKLGENEDNYIYIYLKNPSKYEIEKTYKITIY